MKRLAYAPALILLGGGVWAAVDYYKNQASGFWSGNHRSRTRWRERNAGETPVEE
jgi:hypothetical protein